MERGFVDVCEIEKGGKVGYRGREGVFFQDQEVCRFVQRGWRDREVWLLISLVHFRLVQKSY